MEHVTLPRDLAAGLELQLELHLEVELQPKHEILQDMESIIPPQDFEHSQAACRASSRATRRRGLRHTSSLRENWPARRGCTAIGGKYTG